MMIVCHKVRDYGQWRPIFDRRRSQRWNRSVHVGLALGESEFVQMWLASPRRRNPFVQCQ
jgi:hypothetical protein